MDIIFGFLIPIVTFAICCSVIYYIWRVMDFSTPDGICFSIGFLYLSIGSQFVAHYFYGFEFGRAVFPVTEGARTVFIPSYLLFFLGGWTYIRRMKFEQSQRDARAADLLAFALTNTQPRFCLYLRPFEVTHNMPAGIKSQTVGEGQRFCMAFGGAARLVDFEVTLHEAIGDRSPLIGLGCPGEAIGAGRILTDDETWKQKILVLMDRCEAIFIIPSLRPGTLWELEQIKEKSYLNKTVFVLRPNIYIGDYQYQEVSERVSVDFQWTFPDLGQIQKKNPPNNGLLRVLFWELGPGPPPLVGFFTLTNAGAVSYHLPLPQNATSHDVRNAINTIMTKTNRPQIGHSKFHARNQVAISSAKGSIKKSKKRSGKKYR